MPDNKQESSTRELYKTGKIDRRRSSRPALVPDKVEQQQNIEEDSGNIKLRPEVVVLALTVILLLIIAAVAI